jgi:TonB family protein
MASASHSHKNPLWGLLLPLVLAGVASAAFSSKNSAESAALIEHARRLSDIRGEGARPFRLRLDFKAIRADGGVTEGSYTEVWVSKAQWRKETVLGAFRRTQVAAGGKRWVLDSSADVPEQVKYLPLLGDTGRFQSEAWAPQKDGKINGVGAHCLKNDRDTSLARWELCFDKETGTLMAEIRPSQVETGTGERVCVYSDYQKFGEYTFARSYECTEDKHLRLTARVVELVAEPAQEPALFSAPEGAKESVNCVGLVKPPQVVHRENPKAPGSFSGTTLVVVSLDVGIDGRPNSLTVTSAANHDYDEAALRAVRQWRFKPATCDGQPVEIEIAVETVFHHYQPLSHDYAALSRIAATLRA